MPDPNNLPFVSQTDICNMALSRIGSQAIADITDRASTNARACNKHWTQCVAEVGRSGRWNRLSQRGFVQPESDYPPADAAAQLTEWTAKYRLPQDFLRLTELNGIDVGGFAPMEDPSDLYEIIGHFLFCDGDVDDSDNILPANLKYVAYTDDTSHYDPLFVSALTVLLASRIVTEIKKGAGEEVMRLLQEYETVLLPRARKTSANERRPRPYNPIVQSAFLASRRCSTNG